MSITRGGTRTTSTTSTTSTPRLYPRFSRPTDKIFLLDSIGRNKVGIKTNNFKGEKTTFRIGAIVILAKRYASRQGTINVGTTGIIRRIASTGSIGVEIQGHEGHDLNGTLPIENGAYLTGDYLEVIINKSSDFDQLRKILEG